MYVNLWTTGGEICLCLESCKTVKDVEDTLGLEKGVCYVLSNGHVVSGSQQLVGSQTYHVVPRVLGGKGGFGSMLRAIGAQIEKTTSREACRDLSGRRVRDVNNEKKLKEWVAKQAEREREKEERRRLRREKRDRLLAEQQPKLEDPAYHEQYAKAQDDLQSALQAGLQRVKEKERKRRAEEPDAGPSAKRLDWLGTGIRPEDLDTDSDSDSGNSSGEACAAPSTSSKSHTAATATLTSASLQVTDDSSSSSASKSEAEGSVTKTHAACSGLSSDAASVEPGSSDLDVDSNSANPSSVGEEKDLGGSGMSGRDKEQPKDAEAETADGTQGSRSGQKGSLLSSLPPPSNASSNGGSHSSGTLEPVDLEQYSSAEDLEILGLEHLKNELTRRGLKCGGSLPERAERLFSIKGLTVEQINPKLLAKPAKGKGMGKNRL